MRICLFAESIDKKDGGPSRSVPILARGLSEIGVDTTLMVVESDEMNTHLLNGTAVRLIVLSRKASFKDYLLKIGEGNYDIIHSQCIWLREYHKVALSAKRLGIPLVITPRGTLEPWAYQGQGFFNYIKKRMAMELYQKGDMAKARCILATANMEANNIRRLGISTPIAIIPNGIDVSEYKCRSENCFSAVKKQIVFISRIHQKKGIEFLIEAWSQLHEKYNEWNVVIAGNGDQGYINSLKKSIIEKGLQGSVSIIPPVFGEEKYKLYCESSIFILPTYSENFGMVIAEAMSCGLPVITTTGTPWLELNEIGIGWCIDLSLSNLTNCISQALDLGCEELFNMGLRCSKYVRDNYYYLTVANKNKELYQWILGNISKPSFVI